MKNQFKYICLILFFGIISISNINSYLNRDSVRQKNNFVKMMEEQSKTIALIDSTYEVFRSRLPKKLGAITVKKKYEIGYKYTVKDVSFSGTKVFQKLPENRLIEIYYLKDKPSIHSFNPKESIKNVDDSGEFNIAMSVLFGFVMVYFMFKYWKIIKVNHSTKSSLDKLKEGIK